MNDEMLRISDEHLARLIEAADKYESLWVVSIAGDYYRIIVNALRELSQARRDLETERLRLAACGVPYARERVQPGNPYYSASLKAVYDLADRLAAIERP